jgi:hypothetical protein
MKKQTLVLFNVLLVASLLVATRTSLAENANLLKDASFEEQTPPAEGGWTLFDNSRISTEQARTGTHAIYNWGFSQTMPSPPFLLGTASGSFQEFPAEPGSRWRLTGYGLTTTKLRKGPAFGIVQLSFFDDEGNDLGTVETAGKKTAKAKTSNQVNRESPVGEWVLLDTDVATAPANTTKVHAFTLFVDYTGSNIPQGVYFDDVKLCSLDKGNGDVSTCQ